MPTQTERKNAISQKMRLGIPNNCGSLCCGEFVKTSGIEGIPGDGTANRLSEPRPSLLQPQNPPGASCDSSGNFCVGDHGTTSIEMENPDAQIAYGGKATHSPNPSCSAQQQGTTPPRGASSLHGEPSVHPERPLPGEEFTEPQMQMIFRTAYRITRNREDAEDAMQEACLQAVVHLKDFDGRAKFSTWLTRITINASFLILRKQRHARIVSLTDLDDSGESKKFQKVRDPAPDAEKRYLQKERETALREQIHALRPTLKGAIELGPLSECSLRETADTLGVSVGAVKARLFHARRTLRKSRGLRPFRNDQQQARRTGANKRCV